MARLDWLSGFIYCIIILCPATFQCIGAKFPPTSRNFDRSEDLQSEVYKLHWTVDIDTITVEIQVRTNGWIGFGLSPNGDMIKSDVVTGWVSDGKAYFQDRFAEEKEVPSRDLQQDWRLIEGHETGQFTCLTFTRLLRNCDLQDLDVEYDNVWVIFAWHENDPPPGGDIMYHTNRGKRMVNLMEKETQPQLPPDAVKYFFGISNYAVPKMETVYVNILLAMPQQLHEKQHYLIKLEHGIYEDNKDLVHHLMLKRCGPTIRPEWDGVYWDTTGRSSVPVEGLQGRPIDSCFENIYSWTVGGKALVLPDDVAMPFGGMDDAEMLMVEIHYDNPTLREELLDHSGVTVWVLPNPRPIMGSLLYVAHDINPDTEIIPPGQKRFYHYGICTSDCLKPAMEESGIQEINVFAATQHAHLTGRALRTRHFRNGKELPPLLFEPNYDFNFQQTRMLQTHVKVFPGDELVIECGLETLDRNFTTRGGNSSRDEMCEVFVYYYPKLHRLNSCISTPDVAEIAQRLGYIYFSDEHIYNPETSEWRSWSQIIEDPTTWTAKRSEALQEVLRSYAPRMICVHDTEFPPSVLLRQRRTYDLPAGGAGYCSLPTTATASRLYLAHHISAVIITVAFLFCVRH